MPLVEYRCVECHRTIEVIQKFSDPDLADCSVCGGALERLLSAPAIHFKGSGWYVSDYARKGANGASSSSSSAATADKPAEKSEAKSTGSDGK